MPIGIPDSAVCDAVELPFKGKLFAYVATAHKSLRNRYILSIVVDGESGHYPQSYYFTAGTESDMKAVADVLNRERLWLPKDTVLTLITQSMRGKGRRRNT